MDYNAVYSWIGEFLEEWLPITQVEKQHENNAFLCDCERGLQVLQAKHRTKCFNVALVALCKSGKSTFLNAMMGRSYLPSTNAPETACIVRVKHNPKVNGKLTYASPTPTNPNNKVTIEDAQQINQALHRMNSEARATNQILPEAILEAPLLALADRSFDSSKTSFDVSDTPGPNEAGADVVREQVEILLNTADVILYIMDYTKLKTAEETKILTRLRSMRPDLLKDLHKRLFIAVNKIDQIKKRHGLDFNGTKEYVSELLQREIPELQISPDRILPVSAEHALLSRQIINNTATANEREDICSILFGQEWEPEDFPEERIQTAVGRLLKKSYFPEMEEKVLSFIFEHQGNIFISSLVGDALRHLSVLNNFLRTTRAAMQQRDNEGAIAKLNSDLKNIKVKFDEALTEFNNTEKKMSQWVEQQFSKFENQLTSFVDEELASEAHIFRVHESVDQHKAILNEVNSTIADKLGERFTQFRKELEIAAYYRQKDIFDTLAKYLQPFLDSVGDTVGKFLCIEDELMSTEFQFPELSMHHFRLNIDNQISALLVAKTSLVKMIKGWCTKGGLVLGSDMQYTTNVTALKRMWYEKIKDNTTESLKTAHYMVKDKIRESLQAAEDYLQRVIDGYSQTITKALIEARDCEERRIKRIEHLNTLIDKERDVISKLRELERDFCIGDVAAGASPSSSNAGSPVVSPADKHK